jgi:putative flippase GtrA
MNPVRRWLRFNLVGLAGMLVQLVTLAGLNHIVRGHYLLLSAIAVETAILHNFVAHIHYTWRDRTLASRSAGRDRSFGSRSARRDRNLLRALHNRHARIAAFGALWRFQVSNGGVSLVGNLVLMRLLVGTAHLPVLLANLISILICGLVNFWLGDRWAFAPHKRRVGAGARRCATMA